MSLLVLFGALGLVVDIGWAYYRREACKTAAQAASTAAAVAALHASGYSCVAGDTVAPCRTDWACPNNPANPPGDSLEGGCLYAKEDGFSNANPRQSVVMSAGNSGSPAAGTSPAYWVSATVSERLPQLFSAVLGNTMATVSVRSVTGVYLQPKGACIYALDGSGTTPAITVNGSATVSASCGVYDNGSLTLKGGSNLAATTANVHGSVTVPKNATFTYTNLLTPAPTTPDPFASIPPPDYPPNRCDSTGITAPVAITMPADNLYVICGNVTVNAGASQNFPSGMYVVKDGTIKFNGGNVTGAQVTFYMTGSSYGGVAIAGNGSVTLSAPSDGLYRGMIFFLDRSLTNPPSSNFTGGSGQVLDGTIYMPTSSLTYSGGSQQKNSYTGIVADNITFTGDSVLKADTDGQHTGLGLPEIGVLQ